MSQAKKPGEFIHKPENIPVEVKSHVSVKMTQNKDGSPILGTDNQPLKHQLVTPRENGVYKGAVILNNNDYLVQKINDHTAVAHKKGDVNLKGNGLADRDKNNTLHGAEVQIYYTGSRGNAYPWDSAKSKEVAAAKVAQPDIKESLSKVYDTAQTDFVNKAVDYANQNIKNAKQREAFIKHIGKVAGIEISTAKPVQNQSPQQAPEISQEKVATR